MFLISTKFLLTSSCAFSAFLSPRSSEATASLSAFTSSCGLFCDLPNSGIVVRCGFRSGAAQNVSFVLEDLRVRVGWWKESWNPQPLFVLFSRLTPFPFHLTLAHSLFGTHC
uniref:Secreted peptide n=1 Tax=Anopheles braziliensis TaxID=58242 RepID=A0A2M3ZLL2_9DIPT